MYNGLYELKKQAVYYWVIGVSEEQIRKNFKEDLPYEGEKRIDSLVRMATETNPIKYEEKEKEYFLENLNSYCYKNRLNWEIRNGYYAIEGQFNKREFLDKNEEERIQKVHELIKENCDVLMNHLNEHNAKDNFDTVWSLSDDLSLFSRIRTEISSPLKYRDLSLIDDKDRMEYLLETFDENAESFILEVLRKLHFESENLDEKKV